MKKQLLAWLCAACCCASAMAQAPQFTQFFNAPLYLNPAFTGTSEQWRAAANYRNQWLNLGANFQSTTASIDYNAAHWRSGFGALLVHDRAGSLGLNATTLGGTYAFVVPISKQWQMRLGLQAALGNRTLNGERLLFVSQVRPDEPDVWESGGGSASRWWLDVGSGLLLYNSTAWLGAAVHHLNAPDQSFFSQNAAPLPRKYSFHAGLNLPIATLNGEIYLLPSVLYKMQGAASQLDAGCRLALERFPVSFGAFYRGWSASGLPSRDALAGFVGLQKNGFTFGYSYDITISGLAPYSGGSHELSVIYEWAQLDGRRSFYDVQCPTFGKPRRKKR